SSAMSGKSSSDSSSSSSSSSSDSSNKTPVPEPPVKCSEMKDQDMCEKDANADYHCKWDEDDNECYKGCPSDGRALEDSMRSLRDVNKCPCPNFFYDSGDKECKKCPAGSIAISESVCSEVLTDATIGNSLSGTAPNTAIQEWFYNEAAATAKWGHISDWDTSKVTNMQYLFFGKRSFNEDISGWDVSKVITMYGMFRVATAFNQPIGNWDVSKVTDMRYMFKFASTFNQPISNWDVSQVITMEAMFYKATDFSQDLSTWCVESVIDQPPTFFAFNTPNFIPEFQPIWNGPPEASCFA
ncbi:hypothetical protein TeGR_g3838, partial [Tetraparma gracilis]